MDERFVALAAFVRGASTPAGAAAESASPAAPLPEREPAAESPPQSTDELAHDDVLRELTLMRLAAHEAFERTKDSLLASLAECVLGRELALAPAELESLVAGVVDASRELEPVSLVLNAFDARRLRTPLPTRIDPSLAPGDFIVEVRDGALESPLSFRLRAATLRASVGAA